MEDDDESWRDIESPAFPAATLRQNSRVKRVKVEPDIKDEPDIKVEPDSDDSCPPSPSPSSSDSDITDEPDSDASRPPSPSPSSPSIKDEPDSDDSRLSSPDIEDASDSDVSRPPSPSPSSPEPSSPEPSSPCSSPPSPSSPTPEFEPPEIKTEITRQPKCRSCKKPAVLMFTSPLNPLNADRPYFICALCPWADRWVCWADQEGMSSAVNPPCKCKGNVSSRLDIIGKKETGKFGRGFWTCVKGKCDYYSENLDGEPGVSFDGGFYPRFRGGKRKCSG